MINNALVLITGIEIIQEKKTFPKAPVNTYYKIC